MGLYTFVIDFDDQTHFSQLIDISPENALKKWVKNLDLKSLGVKNTTNDSLLSEMEYVEERPVAIKGVKNVWCVGFKLDAKFALTHIIKTSEE
jgi:hypothetical protein